MPNPILAIPPYVVLCYVPYFYSQSILYRVDMKLYDNVNPRAPLTEERYKKALGPVRFARRQRAMAAHHNGLESMPYMAVAVLAGTFMGISHVEYLAVTQLLLRAVYNVLYIGTTTQPRSYLRTVCFLAMMFSNAAFLIRAGLAKV